MPFLSVGLTAGPANAVGVGKVTIYPADVRGPHGASVIRKHLAAGAVDHERASAAIEDLIDLPLLLFPTAPFLRRAWTLRENVTPYGACYVALAETLACTMLTADGRLARAPGLECPIELA
jgi:predicted nucleic acid-binding protein